MNIDAKMTAARAFVRSLNILLKFARLYGFEHVRTAAQFETAWDELRAAVPSDSEAGLLLAAAGSQLLLDGVPMGGAPAERSFAQLLSAAGLASIHFSPQVTQDDLGRLVRAFPAGTAKAAALAEQLKSAVADAAGIRINEIRFVPEDGAVTDFKMAAQLTARALGASPGEMQGWFNDPQKLLQLIAAAEGSQGGAGDSGGGGPGGGGGTGTGGMGQGGGTGAAPMGLWAAASAGLAAGTRGLGSSGTALAELGISASIPGSVVAGEEDLRGIMRLLRQLGKAGSEPGEKLEPAVFHQRLSSLPVGAQLSLRRALASLAAQAPTEEPKEAMLVKLAQHLAIRFALDSYERGEVRVNAVRQMFDRMGQEIEGLRKILGAHEEKMAQAGLLVETHAETLDRQFWAEVPEENKRAVLASSEAWCVPAGNLRQFVGERMKRGEMEDMQEVLRNYASCLTRAGVDGRRRTAIGLAELADLYASEDGHLLTEAIGQVGAQLSAERDLELQSLVSAAFVRLTQEAATRRCYPAMQLALGALASVEKERPIFAQSLRPRVGLESRVLEFIEDALRAECIPDGLAELMRLMPGAAAEHLRGRFGHCGFREDCDLLAELARQTGPECVSHLRESLRAGAPAEAVETLGLLSRLEPTALEQWLPERISQWPRSLHDRAVRQLAIGDARERGRLLVAIFDLLDPLIQPLALEEIGLSGDASTVERLLALADGVFPEGGRPYLRVKAIESLGRLRAQTAAPLLKRIVEAKAVWSWAQPRELRIVAAQALEKIDPDWTQEFLPRSGLDRKEMSLVALDRDSVSSCIRQRRYPRLRLARPLAAVTTNLRENCRLEIQVMNVGGGLAVCDRHLAPGTLIALKINPGLRAVPAQAIVRDARAQAMGFEVVDISLEDRAKLRRLIADLGGSAQSASPDNRRRRSGRSLSSPTGGGPHPVTTAH